MIRVASILLVALSLGACQSSQSAYWGGVAQGVKVTLDVPPTPLNERIAKVSEQLAASCAFAKGGILLADLYISKPQVQLALDTASMTVSRFCSKPPANVDEAIGLVAAAAVDLVKAIEAAKVS